MSNNVSIVTGGVTGIGRAIARYLVASGYTVIICDIDKKRGKRLEEKSENMKGTYKFEYCNVGKKEDIKKVITDTKQKYGKVDVLVNNAGIIRRREEEEISVKDWDEVFNVNSRGAFLFCKYVSEIMKEQKAGKIVNISSIAGKLGDITSAPGYGPSKAALNTLTKTFARELAPYNVTVNAIAPHAIKTEMSSEWSEEKRKRVIADIPMGRMGKPEEIAAVVMFLLSEGANFITGEIIDVNGGFLMD
ncbi:MAG: SDR family NAD(P)-dependent oxidoreductase [Halanaerobiales bacterium]